MKSPRGLPRGDLFFAVSGVKQKAAENRCRKQPAAQSLYRLLEHVDVELAEAVRRKGCRHGHGGTLHRAPYPRKPRGGPAWERRLSLCCDQEGCRRRHTPPSVRFLGRKVYVGFVVVLKAAMHHGLSARRVKQLGLGLPNIDRRTLERWRQWWLGTFAASPFWKAARARFVPPVPEKRVPLGLCKRFEIHAPDGLVKLLRFLAPITTVSAEKEAGM